jgi:hypothetical protein
MTDVFIAAPFVRRLAWLLLAVQLLVITLMTLLAIEHPAVHPTAEKALLGFWLTLVGLSATLTSSTAHPERYRHMIRFGFGLPLLQFLAACLLSSAMA